MFASEICLMCEEDVPSTFNLSPMLFLFNDSKGTFLADSTRTSAKNKYIFLHFLTLFL